MKFSFFARFPRLDADRHVVKQIKNAGHEISSARSPPPHPLSPPIVRFLRVRGRKNGKQRRTVKLHARTTRFWLPQSMSDLEREGAGRRKCDVRDQSRRFGSQNRRGARPRTQLPRPLEEKSGSEGFCLTIYTGGVFTSPRVFTLGFCMTRWCRTGGMANVYFLLLLSMNRFLLV